MVDARAGPGIKSLTKFKTSKNKKKTKEAPEKFEKILKKKHLYSKDGDREQSPAMSDDTGLTFLLGYDLDGSEIFKNRGKRAI